MLFFLRKHWRRMRSRARAAHSTVMRALTTKDTRRASCTGPLARCARAAAGLSILSRLRVCASARLLSADGQNCALLTNTGLNSTCWFARRCAHLRYIAFE